MLFLDAARIIKFWDAGIDRYDGMPDDVSDAILKHAQPQSII